MRRRARVSPQLAMFAAAAVSILAGASFNIQGRAGQAGVMALLAGLLAFAAGLIHLRWRRSAPLFVTAVVVTASLASSSTGTPPSPSTWWGCSAWAWAG